MNEKIEKQKTIKEKKKWKFQFAWFPTFLAGYIVILFALCGVYNDRISLVIFAMIGFFMYIIILRFSFLEILLLVQVLWLNGIIRNITSNLILSNMIMAILAMIIGNIIGLIIMELVGNKKKKIITNSHKFIKKISSYKKNKAMSGIGLLLFACMTYQFNFKNPILFFVSLYLFSIYLGITISIKKCISILILFCFFLIIYTTVYTKATLLSITILMILSTYTFALGITIGIKFNIIAASIINNRR